MSITIVFSAIHYVQLKILFIYLCYFYGKKKKQKVT